MGSEPEPSDWRDRVIRRVEREHWPVDPMPVRHRNAGAFAWVQYLALRALLLPLRFLPRPLVVALLGGVGRVLSVVMRARSRAAAEFVRTALPDLDERGVARLVRQSWRHLFLVATEFEGLHQKLLGSRLGEHFDLEVSDEARRAFGAGGCVLVTAHVGNWEALTGSIFALEDMGPGYAVSKAPRNDPLARYIQRRRESLGVRMIPRRGAMKAVPKVVQAGGSVLLLLDQRPRVKPVWAEFFGRRAPCDRSAGVLVRRLGAPVVFMATYMTDRPWRYDMRVGEVLWPEDLAGLSAEGVANRINQGLERLILERPEQYFWLHERFRGAPEREPAASQATPTEEASSATP